MTPSDDRYSVRSLELGLNVLEVFGAQSAETLNLSEIARRIGVSRSSAFRLVHTLQRLGYLDREPEGKEYRLGSRVMALGYTFLASKDVAELARPVLERLRAETRCSTHLGILEGSEVIYIARYAAHQPVSATIAVGTRLPAHATTMGRMILAYKSPAYVREHFGARRLATFTERTPATVEALDKLLAGDRRRGYVLSHSNFEVGIASIAAPLFDATGEAVAAINVSIPENAIDRSAFDRSVRDAVCAAARKISALLGARPDADAVTA